MELQHVRDMVNESKTAITAIMTMLFQTLNTMENKPPGRLATALLKRQAKKAMRNSTYHTRNAVSAVEATLRKYERRDLLKRLNTLVFDAEEEKKELEGVDFFSYAAGFSTVNEKIVSAGNELLDYVDR